MKSQSHLGVWLIISLVLVLGVPFFMTAEAQYARIEREAQALHDTFGSKMATRLIESANEIHGKLVRESGAEQLLATGLHDGRDTEAARRALSFAGEGIAKGANRYLPALMMQLYGIILRAHLMLFWCLALAPFLVATIIEGMTARAIRVAGFGSTSPTGFAIGTHATIAVMAVPLLYLGLPLGLTVYFMPLWAIGMCVPLLIMIGNTQRIFGS